MLIFERNTDERLLALISELKVLDKDRATKQDRLFVWEASPEIKRA